MVTHHLQSLHALGFAWTEVACDRSAEGTNQQGILIDSVRGATFSEKAWKRCSMSIGITKFFDTTNSSLMNWKMWENSTSASLRIRIALTWSIIVFKTLALKLSIRAKCILFLYLLIFFSQMSILLIKCGICCLHCFHLFLCFQRWWLKLPGN